MNCLTFPTIAQDSHECNWPQKSFSANFYINEKLIPVQITQNRKTTYSYSRKTFTHERYFYLR